MDEQIEHGVHRRLEVSDLPCGPKPLVHGELGGAGGPREAQGNQRIEVGLGMPTGGLGRPGSAPNRLGPGSVGVVEIPVTAPADIGVLKRIEEGWFFAGEAHVGTTQSTVLRDRIRPRSLGARLHDLDGSPEPFFGQFGDQCAPVREVGAGRSVGYSEVPGESPQAESLKAPLCDDLGGTLE